MGALSTSTNTAESLFPSWKEEVNRRVAAHMSHRGHSAAQPSGTVGDRTTPASRAAQAAARVAARYASAPTYSEMLAREALAAACAAEAASRAAQHAHAAAQYVLAGLEAASAANPEWDPRESPSPAFEFRSDQSTTAVPADSPGLDVVVEETPKANHPALEQPIQATAPTATPGELRKRRRVVVEALESDRLELSWPAPAAANAGEVPGSGVAEPIFANLIQFPREVVATRKMRPRRVEGPLSTSAPESQLSIFEVDPGSISIQPSLAALDEPVAPAWMCEEWAGTQFAEPPQESIVEEPEPVAPPLSTIQLASLSRRFLALAVDCTLVVGAFVGIAALVLHAAKALPSLHTIEFISALSVLVLGSAYQSLFSTLTSATPGMWYAGIVLRTLEGIIPTRRQRCARLMALPLSIVPLGLGLAWSLFDDNHLTWHDRLSGTYLRKR